MAQTGYTPILIYSSSTVSQAPSAGNLTNSTLGSELAINITDGKLFYKDNANAVQVIAWKTTPTTAGGTGLTSYAAGDLLYYTTGTTLSKLAIGASTTILTSSGTAPQWSAASNITVGTASNLKSNATTGVMQIVGPAASTTRVMTIPNADFTAARTDAGQTFATGQIFGGTDAVTLPVGTTAQRPTPSTGMIRFNSSLTVMEYYNGTAWVSTGYNVPATVEYLVVAGGGGGGSGEAASGAGGGGGAGGFRTATGLAVTQGSAITVTVGAGGAGGPAPNNNGSPGNNSVFGSITSTGGGYGGFYDNVGGNGGSGGGGGNGGTAKAGGSGTAGQGNNGGSGGTYPNEGAGGGGGASAVGANRSSGNGGNGGAGTASSISGSSLTYAGGGGGGASPTAANTAGTGGSGGGGAGGYKAAGTAGTDALGGGGGGGGANGSSTSYAGGKGGDGVVIIRYPDTFAAATSTTGSPTVTVTGGFRIYRWTTSGSITF